MDKKLVSAKVSMIQNDLLARVQVSYSVALDTASTLLAVRHNVRHDSPSLVLQVGWLVSGPINEALSSLPCIPVGHCVQSNDAALGHHLHGA